MAMERDSTSSEEDEDTQNLVEYNDRKYHSNHRPSPSRSRQRPRPFELESSSLNRHPILLFAEKYRCYLVLGLLLPLLFGILFFSTDIKTYFSSHAQPSSIKNAGTDPLLSRMRESELTALSLLRQQQLSLSSLFWKNHSVGNGSQWNDGIALDDLKSAILNQISVNKMIQQALLSPHRLSNSSNSADSLEDEFNADFQVCEQGSLPSERKTLKWNPEKGKFLLAICLSGQISNHMKCLEKHMFFAAVMRRVLIIPSPHIDYSYQRFLDIDHINECLGTGKEKFVISFDEFSQMKKGHPHLDRFYCYFAKPVPCYVDEDHVKKLKNLGLSVPAKMETPLETEDIAKPRNLTLEDVTEKFSKVGDDVVAIGDIFFANIEENWISQPGGPIEHKCRSLIEPNKLIKLTAQRFVQTFLGKNFVALHFRRHGWLKFCNAKQPSCFYSIPQAADCISRMLARTNSPVIYLSTDAAESETSLLQSLITVGNKNVPLVKRPPPNAAEKWDALLYRHHLEGDAQVEAMLDKTICAMSSVFIGSSGSTFTDDIMRMRKDWGTASSCDEYLCHGELPDFVADGE